MEIELGLSLTNWEYIRAFNAGASAPDVPGNELVDTDGNFLKDTDGNLLSDTQP